MWTPVRRGLVLAVIAAAASAVAPSGQQPSNVILFVPDGLRARMVNMQNAPALAALAAEGVSLPNSHSHFPTFTMPNASALATGHYIGDTGVFGNSIYVAKTVAAANTMVPQIENDSVLGDLDALFNGDFLGETTFLDVARKAGFSTAAIGKHGPALLQDHTARDGAATIVIDDATGGQGGIPLSKEVSDAIAALGLPGRPPARGDNARAGDFKTPGTTTANIVQQAWISDVTARVVLPLFKTRGKPFVMVYWSRDPDASQHNEGDSHGVIEPGINGPTSLAGIRNADDNLRRLRQALVTLGLDATTNILVAADHGFSTVAKESRTSPAARHTYADVMPNTLPAGFLATDLAEALGLPLWETNRERTRVQTGARLRSTGAIGADANAPDILVVANGGSDLIYLPTANATALTPRIVNALMAQDYVSGLFLHDRLGAVPGTLPLSAINLIGKAKTPQPDIVVNFRSFASGCAIPTNCTVTVADVSMQQGQGFHGSFSRGETMNFMAAVGPAFRSGFVNKMPVGNADIAPTIASILRLTMPSNGRLVGRVISEALKNGRERGFKTRSLRSMPGTGGLRTIVDYQAVGDTRYFDAGGFPGRTVGLAEK